MLFPNGCIKLFLFFNKCKITLLADLGPIPGKLVNNSTKISNQYGSFISYIDTITIGFELYGFEFLIGTGKQDFEFKDLECDGGDINCDKSAYEVYNSGKFENYWMDFGIGIVF